MGQCKYRTYLFTFLLFWSVVRVPDVFSQENPPVILKLSLEEVTKLGLRNNFDIQLIRFDIKRTRTDELDVKSIFDTLFEADIRYRNDQSKQSSTIFGTKTVNNDYDFALSKKLPTGTKLSTTLKNNRNLNNSVFTTSPLIYESKLGFSIEQELGKNFFGLIDRGDVQLTKINIQNVQYTSLKKIEQNIALIQKGFWDLVLQQEKVDIEKDIVNQAKRLFELHREKLKDGLVERPEAIASEANYKRRVDQYRLAYNQLLAKSNVLKLLLNIEKEGLELAAGDVSDADIDFPSFNNALKIALETRRDFLEVKNRLKAKDIKISLKKNSFWPQINLVASFERNGLGDRFKKSTQRITGENNPDFFVGIDVSVPLENRKAKAQLKSAQLDKARMLVEIKQLELKIVLGIKDRIRDCLLFKELAESSGGIALLQAQKLEEEEKRFNQGRSNTDTLIRFQEELIRARGEAAEAKNRYQLSLIDLKIEQGILLDEYWDGSI